MSAHVMASPFPLSLRLGTTPTNRPLPRSFDGAVAVIALQSHVASLITILGARSAYRSLPVCLLLLGCSLAVPLASVGSNLRLFVIVVGALLSLTQLVWVGILLFAGTVVFQVVTLPVELDASARAKTKHNMRFLNALSASLKAGN